MKNSSYQEMKKNIQSDFAENEIRYWLFKVTAVRVSVSEAIDWREENK